MVWKSIKAMRGVGQAVEPAPAGEPTESRRVTAAADPEAAFQWAIAMRSTYYKHLLAAGFRPASFPSGPREFEVMERDLDGRRITVWGDESQYTIVVDLLLTVGIHESLVESIASSVRLQDDAYPAFSLRNGRLAGYTLDRDASNIFEEQDVLARVALVIQAAEAVEEVASVGSRLTPCRK